MNSLRRWLYRPKCQVINEEEEISGGSSGLFFRTDSSLLAQFYFADEDLNQVAAELDSFEGRKDPERCTTLVNQLRACQARVLNVVSLIMDEQVKDSRASRDFRVKFPDDVIQENLAGQLWFGAECLAAGSSIMNREVESACMRPLARALTKNLDSLRNVLREQCLRNVHEYTDSIKESLIIFDKLFAEFELSYVSAMVPVKTAHEYDLVQEITVLFSETVQRALKVGLLTRDMIDEYDPALMFTIPRLAIVSGVHIFKDGPLNPDNDPWNLSEMFRPFQTLLLKIRELLGILTDEELNTLERALCSQEEPSFLLSLEEKKKQNALLERQKSREERNLKAAISRKGKDKEESDDGSIENEMTALEIAERLEALALNFETSRNAKLAQSNEHSDHEIHNQSSESLSTSSCSFYSEAEVEERRSLDAERELGSDHSGQTHLQQFTQQLYHEINVDSSNMTDSIPVEERNAFSPEFTEPLPTDVIRNSASVTEHSTSPDATAQDHSQIDNSLEAAAVGRAHFAMNKCDSNDSGLHSEVLSNSDSTFTISSSDSNQHVAISDVPGASECPDYRDTSDAIHGGCTNSHSGSSVVDHTQQLLNEAVAHNDCKDSSDTLILVSEVAHQNIDLCLNVPTGAGGDSARASNSDVGKMTFPSFQPDQGMTAGDIAGKYSDSTSGHPNGTTLNIDVYSTVPDLCCENSLRLNTDSTTLQALPETSGNSTETIMQAPGTADTHADHIASYKCRMNGSASGEVVQTTQELTSMNSSHEVIERSCSEHSRIPDNSKDQICDRGEPTDVFNNRYASKTTEERQTLSDVDSLFPCSNSDMLSIHSTVPPAVIEDRENNNNHIKKCAILSQNSDVHSGPNEETVSASAIRQVDGCVHILISGEQCVADPSSEPVTRSQSPSASITTTKSDTTLSAKTADSTHVVKASIDVAQDSGKLHPAPPPSHNGILNHVLTTNTSSPSAPKASTTKGNYSGIKGSSRVRSLKKSSKLRQQRQETSSSHNHRPGLPSQAKVLIESQLLDSECNHSSETSSYTSDCGDQEEIDLAIKAAENATRQQVRARFESSSDMIHRLFVCISGVADQLQTNFAGDLRNILRAVFDMNCSELVDISPDDKCKDTTPLEAAYRAVSQASRSARRARSSANHRQEPPSWVPDEQTTDCMSCQVPFTFVRRRHHCRNCGKIFCSRCSSNFVPLLHFGQEKAVRVCNRCFMFQVTPFTVRQTTQ